MKCKFVVDVDMDVSTMAASEAAKLAWKNVTDRNTGLPKLEPYFIAGTEYEDPNAFFFCDVGMAIPADEECEKRCKPMTPEQRTKSEMEYKATAAGIHDPADRKLFFAGVITGYQRVEGSDKVSYAPGPNYAAWKKAKDAAQAKAHSDI